MCSPPHSLDMVLKTVSMTKALQAPHQQGVPMKRNTIEIVMEKKNPQTYVNSKRTKKMLSRSHYA